MIVMKLKTLVNDEVTAYWFEEMIKLENILFPPTGNDYLSPEYVRSLYEKSKEGLFFSIDEETNQLAGYFTVIFIDEEQKNHYLNGGHFSELQNIGMKKGENIIYLYTIAVDEKYRGQSCMKDMGKAFAHFLDEKEKEGYFVKEVYAEAVSQAGVKSLTKGFEMSPLQDVNEQGIGHYESKDQLVKYRKKMR